MNKAKVLFNKGEWRMGDIVMVNSLALGIGIKEGLLELYEGEEPNKHVWLAVEPAQLKTKTNKPNG